MTDRNEAIEGLRVFGIVGVIFFHCLTPYSDIFYSGLIVFLILSGYYFSIKSAKFIFLAKFKRLMVPWIFWSFFYGLIAIFFGKKLLVDESLSFFGVIFGSTASHLWFVPFIFVVGLFFDNIKYIISRSVFVYFVWVALIFLIVLAPYWREASLHYSYPAPQWAHALPAVLYGGILACRDSVSRGVFYFLSLSPIILCLNYFNIAGVGVTYFVGMLLCYCIFCTSLANSNVIKFTLLSRLSYGVFFVHPLVIFAAKKFFGVRGFVLAIVVSLVTFLIVYLVARFMPRSFKLVM